MTSSLTKSVKPFGSSARTYQFGCSLDSGRIGCFGFRRLDSGSRIQMIGFRCLGSRCFRFTCLRFRCLRFRCLALSCFDSDSSDSDASHSGASHSDAWFQVKLSTECVAVVRWSIRWSRTIGFGGRFVIEPVSWAALENKRRLERRRIGGRRSGFDLDSVLNELQY